MNSPDWKFWKLKHPVKVWQAAALSLGIDPYRIHRHPEYWDNMLRPSFERKWFRSDLEHLEFRQRCELVETFNKQIPDTVKRMNFLISGETSLAEFAQWAMKNQLILPPEMVEMSVPKSEQNSSIGNDLATSGSENVWTAERKAALRQEHAELVAKGIKAPTRTLAEKYGVSETRIRDLKTEPAKSTQQNSWMRNLGRGS